METPAHPAPHIVLAEDNDADVTLVRLALREAGLDCVLRVIQDGEKAIRFIESLDADSTAAPIDLILLDLHLPRHDGAAVLNSLRSTERHAQTPVIVMSSSTAPRDRDMADRNAVLHYFAKSADLKEFMQLGTLVAGLLQPKGTASGDSPGDLAVAPGGLA